MSITDRLVHIARSPRQGGVILTVGWLAVQVLLLWKVGIETGFESGKYIDEAKYLVQHGEHSSGQYWFYSVITGLVMLTHFLGTGYWLPVAVHLLFSGLSAVILYRLVQRLTGDNGFAFGATLLLVTQYFYHWFNVTLYSESLYFSFSIFYTAYLFTIRRLTLLHGGILLMALAILSHTRPTGFLLFPPTLLYLILRFVPRRLRWRWLTLSGVVGGLVFVWLSNRLLGAGGEYNFLRPQLYRMVICGLGGEKPWIAPPTGAEAGSLGGILQYIASEPGMYAKLFGLRVWYFFSMWRGYFPWHHNLISAAWVYPLYFIFGLQLIRRRVQWSPALLFCLATVGITALGAGFVCDDWHNRFLLAVYPMLIVAATLTLGRHRQLNPGLA